MSDVIEYIIRLKEDLSGKVDDATGKVSVFKEGMLGVGGAIATAFAVDKIIEFTKESINAYNEQVQATAQVAQGLKTMGDASGKTLAQLKAFSEAKMMSSLYDDDEILSKVTATMLTFGNIAGEQFDKAQQAVIDLSTRMGGDLNGAAVQVGKALNDPTQGMTALRRVGVSFSDEQEKVIKAMQATGDIAGAQSLILNELSKEFGGSAQAAFDALTPYQKFQKEVKPLQEEVGELAVQFQTAMIPALQAAVDLVRDAVKWWKEHSDTIQAVAKFLLIAIAPLATIIGLYKTWAIITEVVAVAQGILNAILLANPIILVAAAIGLIIAAFVTAYEQCDQFRAVMQGLGAVLLSLWPILKGTGEIIAGMLTFDGDMLMAGLSDFKQGLVNAMPANLMATFTGAYDASMIESAKKATVKARNPQDAAASAKAAPNKAPGVGSASIGGSKEKVTGTKITTINVNIGKLVEKFEVSTTNLTESSGKIRQLIAEALLTAVNDSQLIATD